MRHGLLEFSNLIILFIAILAHLLLINLAIRAIEASNRKPQYQFLSPAVTNVLSSSNLGRAESLSSKDSSYDYDKKGKLAKNIKKKDLEAASFKKNSKIHPNRANIFIKKAIPLYNKNPKPKYPLRARERGYQGKVLIEAEINVNGDVSGAKIKSASGYKILDQEALRVVKRWRFNPGLKGNAPISSSVIVPIIFKIN